jgi:hypothetical protein
MNSILGVGSFFNVSNLWGKNAKRKPCLNKKCFIYLKSFQNVHIKLSSHSPFGIGVKSYEQKKGQESNI